MSIILDEKTVGTWFIAINPTTDYMAGLRDIGEGRFHLACRTRYHGYTFDPFDPENNDIKEWKEYTITATREHAIDRARAALAAISAAHGGPRVEEVMMGPLGVLEFYERLKACDWIRTRPVVAA